MAYTSSSVMRGLSRREYVGRIASPILILHSHAEAAAPGESPLIRSKCRDTERGIQTYPPHAPSSSSIVAVTLACQGSASVHVRGNLRRLSCGSALCPSRPLSPTEPRAWIRHTCGLPTYRPNGKTHLLPTMPSRPSSDRSALELGHHGRGRQQPHQEQQQHGLGNTLPSCRAHTHDRDVRHQASSTRR